MGYIYIGKSASCFVIMYKAGFPLENIFGRRNFFPLPFSWNHLELIGLKQAEKVTPPENIRYSCKPTLHEATNRLHAILSNSPKDEVTLPFVLFCCNSQ